MNGGITTTYTYDRNGNQLTKATTGRPTETKTYNAFNQLVSLTRPTAAGVPAINASYTYRADGLRHSKVVNEAETIYGWDRGNIVLEQIKDVSRGTWSQIERLEKTWDQIEAKELTWEQIEELISPNEANGVEIDRGRTWSQIEDQEKTWDQVEAKELTWEQIEDLTPLTNATRVVTNRYRRGVNHLISSDRHGAYVHNARGDVVQRVNAQGDVTNTYHYDAFGNELNPNPQDTNPFRYAGEQWDAGSGTYYLRARNYDPGIGRFTQPDPIKDGVNWYVYCDNNPVNRVDPSGLFWNVVGTVTSAVSAVRSNPSNNSSNSGTWFNLRSEVESLPSSRVSWNQNSRTATVNIGGATANFRIGSEGVRKVNGRVQVRSDIFASTFMPESGEKAFLGSHFVVHEFIAHHAGIIIMVDSRSVYFNNPYFRYNTLFGDAIRFATLGAGPGAKEMGSRSGYLHAQINRGVGDTGGDYGIVRGTSSDPQMRRLRTEPGDISRLLNRNRYFMDNHNNTFNYPSAPLVNIPGGISLSPNSFNSNSFAVGLLGAAELSTQRLLGNFPGWGSPIDPIFFGVRR